MVRFNCPLTTRQTAWSCSAGVAVTRTVPDVHSDVVGEVSDGALPAAVVPVAREGGFAAGEDDEHPTAQRATAPQRAAAIPRVTRLGQRARLSWACSRQGGRFHVAR